MFTGEEPCTKSQVAPVRERGLKLLSYAMMRAVLTVAPVRERGLKYNGATLVDLTGVSLP